jgi:hypothetical protein
VADELRVPKPAALVAERLRDLAQVYLSERPDREPMEAVNAALTTVFSEAEFTEIAAFIGGSYDDVYEPGSGAKLLPMLVKSLETMYQEALAQGFL